MRVLRYKFFGEEIVQFQPSDEKAAEDYNSMIKCSEYTDVEMYDVMRIA